MIDLVQKKQKHYQNLYLVEAYFWMYSIQSTEGIKRLPKLNARTKTALRLKEIGPLYSFISIFIDLYNYDIPYMTRLKTLVRYIKEIDKIYNIDKRLLVWLSIVRWLSRHHSIELADIALAEYISLSLKLTDTQSKDALNIAGDLVDDN